MFSGQRNEHEGQYQNTAQCNAHKSLPPAKYMTDGGTNGHTENGCQRKSRKYPGNHRCPMFQRRNIRHKCHGNGNEGTGNNGQEDSCRRQQRIIGSNGAEEIPYYKYHRQGNDEGEPMEPPRHSRRERRSHSINKGKHGNQRTGSGEGYGQPFGNIRQYPHNDEFAGAQCETQ